MQNSNRQYFIYVYKKLIKDCMFHLSLKVLCKLEADNLIELRFYGHVNPLGSCKASQLTYPHFSLAAKSSKVLTSTCAHSFPWNWQLPFLNLQKGENNCRKYFMINFHEICCRTWSGSKRSHLITVGCTSDRATKASFEADKILFIFFLLCQRN